MAYSRPPVQPGRALKRSPGIPSETTAGVLDFALDADIATTTSLGVVQVGSGLSITPLGILSATGGDDDDCCKKVKVKLTNKNYTITDDDYYVGATTNNITLTLPNGELGRVYYVKNQAPGNVKVQCTGNETIDGNSFKTLGTDAGFILVFDGSRWNIL
jgi:hypothetical protein